VGDVIKQIFYRLGDYVKDPSLAGSDFSNTLNRLQGKPEPKKVGIYLRNEFRSTRNLEKKLVLNSKAERLYLALLILEKGNAKQSSVASLILRNIKSHNYASLTSEQKNALTPELVRLYNSQRAIHILH
jgi:hypothetical protein